MNRKTAAALISVISNSCLIVLKLIVGLLSGSVSIISEAIHSAMDLLASLIALFSVRQSDQPPDKKHPYGHDKIENISGVIEALLILLAAAWIIIEAIRKMFNPSVIENIGLGFLVMLFSSLVNILVSRHLYKVATQEDSVALAADALHLRADVLTSMGVAIGLLFIWVAGLFGHDLHILDPIIAIAVALFIIREAFEMLNRSFQPLLDHSLTEEEETIIEQEIQRHCHYGGPFHNLRTRRAGRRRYIDFHLSLPGDMSVSDSHQLCDVIERAIEQQLPYAEVLIHVEPLQAETSKDLL
ncbi:MAG: cation diffusion facilitator family transporter [Enterobacteriaceae bacterium]